MFVSLASLRGQLGLFAKPSPSVLFAIACGVVACGGATDSGLFGGGGGLPAIDASAPTTGGDDTGNPGLDSGAPRKAHDSGAPSSKPDASGDPGGKVDAAQPQPSGASIVCNVGHGVSSCDAATSICCRLSGATNDTYSCTSAPDCTQPNALQIPCDNADDCAAQGYPGGSVCCVTEDSSTGLATTVACVPPGQCTAQTQTVMCEGTGVCPNSQPCVSSTGTIPGYKICRKQ